MKFNIKNKEKISNVDKYKKKDLGIAREFSKKVYKELGEFVKSIVVFGSTIKPNTKEGDIDVLIILDDTRILMNEEIVQTYRIIVEKIIATTSTRLHIQSMKWTVFWEYIRAGDPVAINILRGGVALIDTGFFEPLQILLREGRIRPTSESIWTYFTMAPNSLSNSKKDLLNAMMSLYWAAIDASHAALMSLKEIPPSPDHVTDMLDEKMVKKGLLDKKYLEIMKKLYEISKGITHRNIKEISGKEYDKYYIMTKEFVDFMKKFIEKRELI